MLSPDPTTEGAPQGSGRLGSISQYAVALAISVFAVVSQYFLPQAIPALRPLYGSFLGGLFVVYGIPILAFAILVGLRPLDRFAHRPISSAGPALGWFGALSLLSLGVLFVLVSIYLLVDPGALDALQKPNPVLESARGNPWFWIGFSFVIGAVEETIFRGWIFGYWLTRGSSHTGWHAVWTSALFAGVHVYYGATYGLAAPLVYPSLFFLGLAFALAVRASGGNLVWVAVLHGANDAAAFLSIVSPTGSLALRYGLILIGAVIALLLWLRGRPGRAPPSPLGDSWSPYPGPGGGSPFFPTPAVPVRPPPLPPPPPFRNPNRTPTS